MGPVIPPSGMEEPLPSSFSRSRAFFLMGTFILLKEMENITPALSFPLTGTFIAWGEWNSNYLPHTLFPSRVPLFPKRERKSISFPLFSPHGHLRFTRGDWKSLFLSHVLSPLRAHLFFWAKFSPRGHLYSSKENGRASFPPTLIPPRALYSPKGNGEYPSRAAFPSRVSLLHKRRMKEHLPHGHLCPPKNGIGRSIIIPQGHLYSRSRDGTRLCPPHTEG